MGSADINQYNGFSHPVALFFLLLTNRLRPRLPEHPCFFKEITAAGKTVEKRPMHVNEQIKNNPFILFIHFVLDHIITTTEHRRVLLIALSFLYSSRFESLRLFFQPLLPAALAYYTAIMVLFIALLCMALFIAPFLPPF